MHPNLNVKKYRFVLREVLRKTNGRYRLQFCIFSGSAFRVVVETSTTSGRTSVLNSNLSTPLKFEYPQGMFIYFDELEEGFTFF